MLFNSNRNNYQPSTTRDKSATIRHNFSGTPGKKIRKQIYKVDSKPHYLNKTSQNNKQFKSKQIISIIQCLQQSYALLSFDDFDAYPIQNIQSVKDKLVHLCTTLKDQPVCRKHGNLLNLYCENDRQVLCVSCVYKTSQHRQHRIKSIDTVEKVIQHETLRSQQKVHGQIHQLEIIKDQIDAMAKEVEEYYHMISNYTVTIISDCIDTLNELRVNMEKKLGLSYRRTNTIITRYSEAVVKITALMQYNISNAEIMKSLGKYILLKQLTFKGVLVEDIISKFEENKRMIEQWRQHNNQIEKIVSKHKVIAKTQNDYYQVKEF